MDINNTERDDDVKFPALWDLHMATLADIAQRHPIYSGGWWQILRQLREDMARAVIGRGDSIDCVLCGKVVNVNETKMTGAHAAALSMLDRGTDVGEYIDPTDFFEVWKPRFRSIRTPARTMASGIATMEPLGLVMRSECGGEWMITNDGRAFVNDGVVLESSGYVTITTKHGVALNRRPVTFRELCDGRHFDLDGATNPPAAGGD